MIEVPEDYREAFEALVVDLAAVNGCEPEAARAALLQAVTAWAPPPSLPLRPCCTCLEVFGYHAVGCARA